MLRKDSRTAPRRNRIQPRKISIILEITQSRLIPIATSTKKGIENDKESGKSGRNFRYYPDGKSNKKINEAAVFRNTAAGFNGCTDEKSSEMQIACAICKMKRDASRIVPTINEIGYKVMIASHFILFSQQLFRHKKVMISCPHANNDNIVPPVSIVI